MERNIVAIQTPHYALNYGAQLQAYALGQAVKALGYDIEYIDRRPAYFYEFKNPLDKMLKIKEYKIRAKNFEDFESRYLVPKSIRILHNEEYDKLNTSNYRAIIVGSDQIWRDDYFYHSFEYSPYLYFVHDREIRKISYAASFGKSTCTPPEERRHKIAACLKDFYRISVRENSGVKILQDVYGVNGICVADPTLLHNEAFYVKKLEMTKLKEPLPLITTYILGQSVSCFKLVESISKKLEMPLYNIYKKKCFNILYKRPFNRLDRFKTVPTMQDWLFHILNSKYVLTDSFHGMIFSILFKKPFVVFNRKAGGSERYNSLLGILGLQNRLCDWDETAENVAATLMIPIDYDEVYEKLSPFIEKSLAFLRESLK